MDSPFARNRRRLAEMVGPEGLAVVTAGVPSPRNPDVENPFRQDSDFLYLTGFGEPHAALVIAPDHPQGEFTLFVQPKDRQREIWDGPRAGVDGAKETYGADAAYPITEFDKRLLGLAQGRSEVWLSLAPSTRAKQVMSLLDRAHTLRTRLGVEFPRRLCDLRPLLSELRLRKTAQEIQWLREACDLTMEGHREAMRFAGPGRWEYQVQAAMENVWRMGGSPRDGYPSIVASGPNACILHYVNNSRRMEDGDLLLVDAACEVNHFTSDITRTFPVSGSYTAAQLRVYQVVLDAQEAAIAVCLPGSHIRAPHEAAVEALVEGMVELGLLPTGVEDAMNMHLYQEFFMHGTSHWLGMDVHDVGVYRVGEANRRLEPGMSLTVEPGLYVDPSRPEVEFAMLDFDSDQWAKEKMLDPAASARHKQLRDDAPKVTHTVPPELLGIGVRIEDDVVITDRGHEVLTAALAKAPDDVEQLCQQMPLHNHHRR
ncbi:MAG: aminopeptidase P N-terminal domain-containing protein [Actinomycetia bacterium]|nr:aminopeptidase P N-terminal domain-containing protein [Actinomycetes bacterium]